MPSNYAIGALGYPSLGATDYQALAAIMNTPNPNSQVAFRGNTQTTQTTAQPQVQYVQQPEKKNSKALIVLGVIGALGAGACIYAACKGEGTGLARIKDGFGKMLDGVKGAVSNTTTKAAETAEEAITSGKRTVQKLGDKAGTVVVTLPGQENKIYNTVGGKISDSKAQKCIADQLKEIGVNANELTGDLAGRLGKDGTLKAGNSLESIVMEGKITSGVGRGTYTIIGAQGGEKITIMQNGVKLARGKGLEKGIDGDLYDRLVEQAKNVFSGKTKLNDSSLKLHQAIIKDTSKETGLVSRIKIGGLVRDAKTGKMVADTSKAGEGSILSAISEKFGINHKLIKEARLNDKAFDEKLTAFVKEKKEIGKGLDAVVRKYYDKTTKCTFTLDSSGNVVSYQTKDGKVVDAIKNKTDFNAFHYDNQKLFDDLKKYATDKPETRTWASTIFEI